MKFLYRHVIRIDLLSIICSSVFFVYVIVLFFFLEFVQMWGIIFIVTTTLVALLKKEQTGNIATEDQFNIPDSYRLLFKIFKLSAVQKIAVILLTCKVIPHRLASFNFVY